MPGRESNSKSINTSAVRLIVLLAIIIFVGSGVAWWRNVSMSPNNVFWGMINNNLSSVGVTRHVFQSAQGRTVDRYIRLQFGSINAAESTVTLSQSDETGKSVIKSETIGTPDADFSRYLSIKTSQKTASGKPIDDTPIAGLWGKSASSKSGQGSNPQYFQQAILTIVPYGNFNQSQRQALVNQMVSQKIYDFSPSTAKSDKQNSRSVFIYQVKIAPAAYVELMQSYAKALGLGDIGLDPSSFANSTSLNVELTVDKVSRHLVKINYPSSGQTETLIDQNLMKSVSLPVKTISINELQNRIQSIVQ